MPKFRIQNFSKSPEKTPDHLIKRKFEERNRAGRDPEHAQTVENRVIEEDEIL